MMDLPVDSLALASWSRSSDPESLVRFRAPGADLTVSRRSGAPDHDGRARFNFEALFADEYERMLGLAFLIIGSREAAEDVVHDSFARVWERWNRIDNPGAYLRTVVVNRCRDVLRRRRVRRLYEARHVEPDEPENDYLLDLLATLPAKRRSIVVLRFFEQLTITEIGQVLQMREGTVKSALHRSLHLLRSELPDE